MGAGASPAAPVVPAAPAAHAALAVGGGLDGPGPFAGLHGHAAAGQDDPALALRVVAGGGHAVAPGGDVQGAAQHQHGVPAPDPVQHGGDGNIAARDHQVGLALDAVLLGAVYNQGASPVDGQVVLRVQGRADGVVVVRDRGAVRQNVLRPFGQGDDQLVGLLFIDGRALLGGDGNAV